MSTVKMEGTNVYRGYENQFSEALDAKSQIAEHREAIQNDPNLTAEQKEAQLKHLDQLEQTADLALDLSTKGGKFDTNKGSIAGDKDMAAILHCLSELRAGLEKFEATVGTAKAQASSDVDSPSGSGGTGGTKASDDDKKAAQNEAYDANFKGKTPEDLANWASADPQAFYGAMRDLSPEDRQMTMMMMNQYLQDMNQMFSMMSNLSKAMHDTAKALISNMRV